MKKIIMTLCFILIALTGAASVCACDADNCTLETDFGENNVENIELGTNDTQIAEGNDDNDTEINANNDTQISANKDSQVSDNSDARFEEWKK